jgi:death-on-curing protein
MGQIAEPVWIEAALALAIHDRQLAEHRGPMGVRDASAMELALGRPRNQWAYGEADLCALAAAYSYGVARNHPFVDGNNTKSQ